MKKPNSVRLKFETRRASYTLCPLRGMSGSLCSTILFRIVAFGALRIRCTDVAADICMRNIAPDLNPPQKCFRMHYVSFYQLFHYVSECCSPLSLRRQELVVVVAPLALDLEILRIALSR